MQIKNSVLISVDPNDVIDGVFIAPEGITSIGEAAFRGCCSSLTSVILPESITSIGKAAFSFCTSLTSIKLPESITSIDHYTFGFCCELISIKLPENITSIDECAFVACNNLTSITLQKGITSIGEHAFHDCSNLTSINIITSTPEEFERIKALLPEDLRQRANDVINNIHIKMAELEQYIALAQITNSEQSEAELALIEQLSSQIDLLINSSMHQDMLQQMNNIVTKRKVMLFLDNNQLHEAVEYFINAPKPSTEIAFALASALLASSDNTKEAHQSILDLFNEYDDDTDIRMLLERSILSTLSLLSKEQPAALSDSLADYTIDRCLPCSSILKTINEIQDLDEELRKQLNEAESLLPMHTAIEIHQLINTAALKDAFLKKYGTTNIVTYESIVLFASKQEVDTFCQRKNSSPRTELDRELITNMLNDAAVRARVSESTHQPAPASNGLGNFGLFSNSATGINVSDEITPALKRRRLN